MSTTASRAEATARPETARPETARAETARADAASPAETGTQLLGALERLALIVEGENKALKARQSDRVRAGLADKVAAVTTYSQALKAFQQLGPRREEIGGALRQALDAGARRLRELAHDNAFRLEVSRAAQRSLIDHIVEAAKGLAGGPGTYSRAGTLAYNAGGKAAPPPALSLNQAF